MSDFFVIFINFFKVPTLKFKNSYAMSEQTHTEKLEQTRKRRASVADNLLLKFMNWYNKCVRTVPLATDTCVQIISIAYNLIIISLYRTMVDLFVG